MRTCFMCGKKLSLMKIPKTSEMRWLQFTLHIVVCNKCWYLDENSNASPFRSYGITHPFWRMLTEDQLLQMLLIDKESVRKIVIQATLSKLLFETIVERAKEEVESRR